MFLRLLVRAATVRRSRTLTAFFAIAIAAAVATALLNLYVDLESKLSSEFRKFGANVVVVASQGQSLSPELIANIQKTLPPNGVAVPFAYVVANTSSGKPIVIAGTDFEAARRLNGWWSVTNWPSGPRAVLVGERAAASLGSEADSNSLTFSGRAFQFTRAGDLRTGGPEDSRIYLLLADFVSWTGVQPSTLELAIPGSSEEVNFAIARIRSAIVGTTAEVRPVRQIVEAETRVLGKTRAILLFSTIVIAVMVALCVLATLTASVLERRRDYAVMKALGASKQLVNAIFISESVVLAAAGAICGFILGSGIAAWIGRVNFHAAVVPRFSVFPAVFAGSLLVALVSAAVPLTILQKIEPAVLLKGD
ncbi:MAG: efflux pump, inner rane subunit [Acidobacteriaceae bacterium]|nr:efflux pump, inner rane subunit [Acidobacteriaceae bacterium]